jgi:hypothetical protein
VPGWAYLRLSDPDNELDLEGRAERLMEMALWHGVLITPDRVIVENDYSPGATPGGPIKPASAHKRKKIRLPNGRYALRTVRPGFRKLLDLIETGVAAWVFCEDLDRLLRQQRDNEDLLDAVELSGATMISLSGTSRLTNGGDATERFNTRMLANFANKASEDTARRVREARVRSIGLSYYGGPRPFGFEHDPAAAKHRKRLLHVPHEVTALRAAAVGLLPPKAPGVAPQGATLRGLARQWNADGLESVSKHPWTGSMVRSVLLKPAIAALMPGLADEHGERPLVAAPWEPILDRAVWEELRAYLAQPGRKKMAGNRPKWLVSVWGLCGKCGGMVRVSRAKPYPIYTCSARSCTSRKVGDMTNLTGAPGGVDDMVAQLVVARLCQPDAAGLARPAPTLPQEEAARLRTERAALVARRATQARLHAEGVLADDALAAGARQIAGALGAIEAKLALAVASDPLAEFRDGRPPAEVWLQLPVERRRAVVQVLVESVTIVPVSRHGARAFNPASVVVVPRSFG